MESMQEQLNELSAYAYSKIGWHQSSIKDIQETLQNISNAIQKMEERWTRNDETTRSFIAAWSRMCRDEVDACFPTSSCLSTNKPHTSKVKLNDYNKALNLLQDPSRMITNISTVDEMSTSIDIHSHTTIDVYLCISIDSHSVQIYRSQIVLKMLKWINLSTIHTCLDSLKEPNLTSNTKPDITACLGACYTWDQILKTSWKDLVATTINACFIKIPNKEFERDLKAAIFKARFTKNSWI
ncbi:hypothetical protein F2Q69_00013330 [Brassica cretica]|uniref:Uncharacterized protein n=1 Tax=Brassica cretica TaxID=69181 RepID=A0A8S9QRC7_BRACR|nr:hypothetical protein F2Q69_00013330 [Brassica cretica]